MIFLLDAIESFFLAVVLVVIRPVTVFRGLRLNLVYDNCRVLCPLGLLSFVLRAQIDAALGRSHRAVSNLESVLGSFELELLDTDKHPKVFVIVGVGIYRLLIKALFNLGQIDDAADAMIRAHQKFGVEVIPGVEQLSLRTAHIIRAGLAAGKLLDQNKGASVVFVSPTKAEDPRPSPLKSERDKLSKKKYNPRKPAKVIPIRRPTNIL